jgi:hypothetical protein
MLRVKKPEDDAKFGKRRCGRASSGDTEYPVVRNLDRGRNRGPDIRKRVE